MKGFFSALLVLTLGVLIVVPITYELLGNEQGSVAPNMTIYVLVFLALIFLAIVFGITYLISEASKGFKPISLPINKEEVE